MIARLVAISATLLLAGFASAQTPTASLEPVATPSVANCERETPHLFHDGDYVIFLGDEVTQQGGYLLEFSRGLSSFQPFTDLRAEPVGRPGMTAREAFDRIDELVIPRDPTMVVLFLGLADSGVSPAASKSDPPRSCADFATDLRAIVQKLRRKNICAAIMPPANVGTPANDALLKQYADAAKSAAEAEGVPFIDANADLQARNLTDLSEDGVHPSDVAADRIGAAVAKRAFEDRTRQLVKNPIALNDGDSVVFIGDSITAMGGYIKLLEKRISAAMPGAKITLTNAGVVGDTSRDALARMPEILAAKPTVAVLYLGFNDGDWADGTHEPFADQKWERYDDSMKAIIKQLRDANVRIVLCSTSPADERIPFAGGSIAGYQRIAAGYAERARILANRENLPFVDLHEAMTRENLGRPVERGLIFDGVHPGPEGHLLIAKELGTVFGLNQKK